MPTDIVFKICKQMLSASPEKSYKRLNPALRSTLANCIEADLPFTKKTFRNIYQKLRGGYWFGDGAGSHVGEHFYTLACSVNHASACQSFEQFANRPAVLWEETVATPFRLHVGAQFTWQGRYLTITSLRKDNLVACTYKDRDQSVDGLQVGTRVGGYKTPYVVATLETRGTDTWAKIIKTEPENHSRIVEHRITISYKEIAEFRRTEKVRVAAVIKEIETLDTEKDGDALSKRISKEHFRHFQLEAIRAAFLKRKDWIENKSRIEAWRNGKNGAWLDTKEIYLRVIKDRVECSNGNSVSLAAVKRALPIVMANRKQTASMTYPLDGHTITKTDPTGVKIGCTLVPWSEVEMLYKTLIISKTTPQDPSPVRAKQH